METTQELNIAQIVKSKAGRDKGRVFAILKILDDKYVNIIDGDLRKINKPKKKKIKHLIVYNKVLTELKEKIEKNKKFNNAYVRKLLDPYKDKEV